LTKFGGGGAGLHAETLGGGSDGTFKPERYGFGRFGTDHRGLRGIGSSDDFSRSPIRSVVGRYWLGRTSWLGTKVQSRKGVADNRRFRRISNNVYRSLRSSIRRVGGTWIGITALLVSVE